MFAVGIAQVLEADNSNRTFDSGKNLFCEGIALVLLQNRKIDRSVSDL
jgi:hypothetical protein